MALRSVIELTAKARKGQDPSDSLSPPRTSRNVIKLLFRQGKFLLDPFVENLRSGQQNYQPNTFSKSERKQTAEASENDDRVYYHLRFMACACSLSTFGEGA